MPVRSLPKAIRDQLDFMRQHAFDPPDSPVGRQLAERLGRKDDDLKPWSDLEIMALTLVETILEQEARKSALETPNRAKRRAAAKRR